MCCWVGLTTTTTTARILTLERLTVAAPQSPDGPRCGPKKALASPRQRRCPGLRTSEYNLLAVGVMPWRKNSSTQSLRYNSCVSAQRVDLGLQSLVGGAHGVDHGWLPQEWKLVM